MMDFNPSTWEKELDLSEFKDYVVYKTGCSHPQKKILIKYDLDLVCIPF